MGERLTTSPACTTGWAPRWMGRPGWRAEPPPPRAEVKVVQGAGEPRAPRESIGRHCALCCFAWRKNSSKFQIFMHNLGPSHIITEPLTTRKPQLIRNLCGTSDYQNPTQHTSDYQNSANNVRLSRLCKTHLGLSETYTKPLHYHP